MGTALIEGKIELMNIAEMLVNLGRTEDAEAAYEELIKQNPDNLEYYRGFLRTKNLDICKSFSFSNK